MRDLEDVMSFLSAHKYRVKDSVSFRKIRRIVTDETGTRLEFYGGDSHDITEWEDKSCFFVNGIFMSDEEGNETVCSEFFGNNFLEIIQ